MLEFKNFNKDFYNIFVLLQNYKSAMNTIKKEKNCPLD